MTSFKKKLKIKVLFTKPQTLRKTTMPILTTIFDSLYKNSLKLILSCKK